MNPTALQTAATAAPGYGWIAGSLHWLTAALLLGSYSLGFYMVDLPLSPAKLQYFSWHKWIGVTVFGLTVLRLGWRLLHRPPPLPRTMPAWERRAAAVSHRLLYLLLLAIPLSGWLMSSAKGFTTVYLARWPLPDALAKNPPLGAALEQVHWALTWLLLGFLLVHVAAAIKHLYYDPQRSYRRMLPPRASRRPA